jgi:hypothetical protein
MSRCAKIGSGGYKPSKEKAARRRLLNSNLMVVIQANIITGFDFRR